MWLNKGLNCWRFTNGYLRFFLWVILLQNAPRFKLSKRGSAALNFEISMIRLSSPWSQPRIGFWEKSINCFQFSSGLKTEVAWCLLKTRSRLETFSSKGDIKSLSLIQLNFKYVLFKAYEGFFFNYIYYQTKRLLQGDLTDNEMCISYSLIFIKSQNTRNEIHVELIKGYKNARPSK